MSILGSIGIGILSVIIAVMLLLEFSKYHNSKIVFDGCIVLPYRMFKKIYKATPQRDWEIFKHRDGYLAFRYEQQRRYGRYYYIRFSTFFDYLLAHLFFILYSFRVEKAKKQDRKIEDTKRALEFVRSIQNNLEKHFASDMSEYSEKLQKINQSMPAYYRLANGTLYDQCAASAGGKSVDMSDFKNIIEVVPGT